MRSRSTGGSRIGPNVRDPKDRADQPRLPFMDSEPGKATNQILAKGVVELRQGTLPATLAVSEPKSLNVQTASDWLLAARRAVDGGEEKDRSKRAELAKELTVVECSALVAFTTPTNSNRGYGEKATRDVMALHQLPARWLSRGIEVPALQDWRKLKEFIFEQAKPERLSDSMRAELLGEGVLDANGQVAGAFKNVLGGSDPHREFNGHYIKHQIQQWGAKS